MRNHDEGDNKGADPIRQSGESIQILDSIMAEQMYDTSFTLAGILGISDHLCRLGVTFAALPWPSTDGSQRIDYERLVDSISSPPSSASGGATQAVLFVPNAQNVGEEIEEGGSKFLRQTDRAIGTPLISQFKNVAVRANCWKSRCSNGFSVRRTTPDENLKLVANIVDSMSGTAAASRARTEFSEDDSAIASPDSFGVVWATSAISDDVLDASIRALVDGYRYNLFFLSKRQRFVLPDWKVALSRRYAERC